MSQSIKLVSVASLCTFVMLTLTHCQSLNGSVSRAEEKPYQESQFNTHRGFQLESLENVAKREATTETDPEEEEIDKIKVVADTTASHVVTFSIRNNCFNTRTIEIGGVVRTIRPFGKEYFGFPEGTKVFLIKKGQRHKVVVDVSEDIRETTLRLCE